MMMMMMMMMTLLTGSDQVSNFFDEESSSVSPDSAATHSHLFGDLVAKRQVENKKTFNCSRNAPLYHFAIENRLKISDDA